MIAGGGICLMQVENGQYVVLQGGTDSSTAAAADSLREIIKHNPAATPPSSSSSSTQPHRPMSVDRQEDWAKSRTNIICIVHSILCKHWPTRWRISETL